MSRECSKIEGDEKQMYVIGGKTRMKETTRKTKTYVDGCWRNRMGWYGMHWSEPG
jgi:hypothetical protein